MQADVELPKELKVCAEAWGRHIEHFSVNAQSGALLISFGTRVIFA